MTGEQLLKLEAEEFLIANPKLYRVIYNQALKDLLKVMKERADDCSDIPNMFDKGYYQAYEHMCYEAEQLKR